MAMIRQHVYYSGHVQGVGFRYNALRCARGYDVTGFARNLPDGRVELVAEGERQEIDSLLEAIQRTMADYISEIASDVEEIEGRFRDFSIRA